ncbi:MAG: 30S ribosomal protein S4e [Nanoarchaeota archaeon]|nr:30S ribosomal protein S4e [Nanoarchaeota archaeon]
MVKNHLKRIAAPRTWHIERKEATFITRPKAGAHPLDSSMALSTVLRMLIKVAKSSKEAKYVLTEKGVLVDGKRKREPKHAVGLMDVVSLPQLNESYRMLLDRKGRLHAIKISEKEAKTKLSRIESKTKIKGNKIQLNLFDGRSLIVDKDSYKTGDVLELELPGQKILSHLQFDKKMTVMLIGGKHAGDYGPIEEIKENKIIYTSKTGEKYETLRKYAFLVGKEKPMIQLE